MTSKQHHKHAKIARPSYGNYCRNEWAILGSTCEEIQRLALQINKALSPEFKSVYIDASHKEASVESVSRYLVQYTSYPSNEQLVFNKKFTPFQFREFFNEADVALINGNHLEGKAQVVIIDEQKKASLQKRLTQLTDLQLILLKNEKTEVFDFVKTAFPHWKEIPVFQVTDEQNINRFFKNKMRERKPTLNALVLAGGQSVRMGHDKTAIQWHGKEQRYYLADLLQPLVNEVFISCRPGQEDQIVCEYKTLPDTFTGLGPYGAILSAFRYNPDASWLVVASDLPLLDKPTLDFLIENRKVAAVATTFSGADEQPEPLITIWESKSYMLLLAQLAQGYSCPRKLLMNNDVHLLTAANPEALMNVNTPEQASEAKQLLDMKLSKA